MDPAGSGRLFRKKIMYPQNALHKKRIVSIGCAPCTRAITQMKTSEPDDGGGNPVIKNGCTRSNFKL
jgi:3'-phosphoadenosine 5'-phosphosulfate sulfotransferase (PAPS reductase)/FAD synthetase